MSSRGRQFTCLRKYLGAKGKGSRTSTGALKETHGGRGGGFVPAAANLIQ